MVITGVVEMIILVAAGCTLIGSLWKDEEKEDSTAVADANGTRHARVSPSHE